jgi:hypothetical protein
LILQPEKLRDIASRALDQALFKIDIVHEQNSGTNKESQSEWHGSSGFLCSQDSVLVHLFLKCSRCETGRISLLVERFIVGISFARLI